jgi:hypothetical protein
MDAIAIDALLLQTLQNRVMYKHLVAQRGQEAQPLLNLLQAVRRHITVARPFHRNLTRYSVLGTH